MKLIDAILSGRPFREKLAHGGGCWWKLGRIEFLPYPEVVQTHTGPQWRDERAFYAECYETMPVKVTLTEEDFWVAVKKTMKDQENRREARYYTPDQFHLTPEGIHFLAKHLGFKRWDTP